MKVVEHCPNTWLLFVESQALFLEVHCKRGGFAHSMLLRLDADETRAYGMEGRAFLDALAAAVQQDDAGGGAVYRKRDAAGLYSDKIAGAMETWQAERTRDGPKTDGSA